MAQSVTILYNRISETPLPDELDVLSQVEVVEQALGELDVKCNREWMDLDLLRTKERLTELKPDLVFNLVETVDGKGRLNFLAPALLESLSIPFTGSGTQGIYLTSGKVLAKQVLQASGIRTGAWFRADQLEQLDMNKKYIVKPIWEDGSVGISEEGVFSGNTRELRAYLSTIKRDDYFIEEYIHGREFNISVLGGPGGPTALPAAEIRFVDFPEGRPHVLGYKSKWEEDSFEYTHTVRSFDFAEKDSALIKQLQEIAVQCWNAFELKGYVRVDFRVDETGKPYVLEINANPCISPDAGFYAASQRAGLSFTDVIRNILYDAENC